MTEASARTGAKSRRTIIVVVSATMFGLALLIVAASAVEHIVYAGSVLPGVHVGAMGVGGETDTATRAAITRLASTLDTAPIHAHAGTQTFVVDPELIGFSVDADATIRATQRAGRHANPIAVVADTVLRRFRPDHVPLAVRYDRDRFEGVLDGWTSALQSGLVEGGLRIRGTTVVPITPHTGRGLLRDQAAPALEAMLTGSTRYDLALPVGDIQPRIDGPAVAAAVTRARALLTGTFVITAGTTRAILTPAQLAPTLGTAVVGRSLELTIDPERLLFVLGPRFSAIELAPVDATFDVSHPNAVTVVPSRDGRRLDLRAISTAILHGVRSIPAKVVVVHPTHTTAWARALGIAHQVSAFTTYYIPGQPRVHNIHLAADSLDNTVVGSGQTFSLNAKLGQRTPEKGYVQAPIEVESGFGLDYGGGISQLTTTLFNAIFFGGYVDVDHSPHHYYVSRYPLGREATIVWPYVDLQFRNDTKHGVLIRATYTDSSVTVAFYGDTDGRVATEVNRKTLHVEPVTDRLVPCPATKPADDPNNACARLHAGELLTTATGETGYDVSFDRLLATPGRLPVLQHYQVHYPMLQNTILVGAPAAGGGLTTTTATTAPVQPTPTTAAKASTTRPLSPPTTAHH